MISINPLPYLWHVPPLLVGFAAYLLLCRLLRFRRVKGIQSRYGFTDRASLSHMTNQEAHDISKTLIYWEFPTIYELSVKIALFETYAVENVARLLVAISDLGKSDKSPKRYEDTEIIYSCFAAFGPTSDVLQKAIARMNYLHAPYIESGKILQKDLLYVLYASVVEPVNFINRYEWRPLTDMETAALGTMWKYIGDMMEIDYQTVLQKDQWKDGIEFLEDVTAFASKYEDEYMRPLGDAHKLGEVLMDMTLKSYPQFVRPIVYKASLVILGERLRRCFGFPDPGLAITTLVYNLLFVRRFAVRYLFLPKLFPDIYISEPDPKTGRMQHHHYLKEPWYVAATFWNRWSPLALLTWASGGMIPGDGGAKMKPEGFLFEDLGPEKRMGKGVEEGKDLVKRVQERAAGGCPFAINKSL